MANIGHAIRSCASQITTPAHRLVINAVVCNQVNSRVLVVSNGTLCRSLHDKVTQIRSGGNIVAG